MDPISLSALAGGGQAITGLASSVFGYMGQRQDYLNQSAFQAAQVEFNNWQAGFNARTRDLNNQYQYWAETVNYNQQTAYAGQLNNYEFAKEIAQATRVMEARRSAGADYIVNSEAIQAAYAERGMQAAVAQQQYAYRALQASAAYQAGAQEGKTMDRYVRNFSKQVGDYNAIQAVNEKIMSRQYSRQQLGQVTDYLNKYNSQQFYIRQPIQQPVMPFPPLPSMVTPAGPSMTGAAPSPASAVVGSFGALLGGLNTGINTYANIKKLATP
jgi:hypothetical protein